MLKNCARDASRAGHSVRPLEALGPDDDQLWRSIADRRGLGQKDPHRLTSPSHTDADPGRPIEFVTNTAKSRKLGFTWHRATDEALT